MLGLKLATDPRWVDIVDKSIEDILVDHAYCEQKAASTCISIIIAYPDKKEVVEALTPIVSEEWGHFRMVLHQLDKRGFSLGAMRKDNYVAELYKLLRSGGSRDDRLVEKLLMCAIIEARSCERFRLLSENIQDDELKEFYKELMISEAGHYRLFLDLAKTIKSEEIVKARFQDLLSQEVKIFDIIPLRGDRIH